MPHCLAASSAEHGAFDLVILGLLISVPIVVYGSTVVLRLVERFPVIIQLGAAVLAFTAAKMVVSEPLLQAWFGDAHVALEPTQMAARWAAYAVAVVGVLAAGWWVQRERQA